MSSILHLCLFLLISTNFCSGVDQTRQPGAIGAEVVDAVVNLIRDTCLFADDKRFLVRLAYVQSHDGHDSKTFRSGYHGGIWQIDENMFKETQNNGRLASEYNIIFNQFGFDWNRVSWSELRKPLYSGVAAALYTKLHGGTHWRIEDQAQFYEMHFVNKAGNNFTNQALILDKGCHGNEKIDMAFVVDRSNSLSSDDFERAKYFIRNVVDSFSISPTQTQVAVVSYSGDVVTEFHLNTYHTKTDVKNAVSSMTNNNAASTATANAIDQAVNDVFAAGKGARPGAVKVIVVITDGDANDEINTRHAAERAQRAGITIFSIGVGNLIQQSTLDAIASNPDCTHVFTVSNYAEIKALKEEIERSTCNAPVYITQAFCCTIGHCPTLAYNTKIGGVTLESNMTCGSANVYTAFSNSNPSQSFYEETFTVSSGTPGVLFVNTSYERPLFISLKDALAGSGGSGNCEICINPKDGDHRNHEVKCYQNGVQIVCPDNCEEKWNLFPHVCTPENIANGKMKFEHPFSQQKYLLCDKIGQLYVVHCPQNQSYYQECEQCVGQGSSCPKLTTSYHGSNPCTLENLMADKFFFRYPPDKTRFIHCDVWGKAWLMDCPNDEVWDQAELTCVTISSTSNPCRNYKVGDPLYYPYPCDPHKYIQCDLWHQSFLMTCQLNFVFNPAVGNCVPKNTYNPPTRDPFASCDIHAHPTHDPTATLPPSLGGTDTTDVPFPTYSFCSSCPGYTTPCNVDNLRARKYHFAVTGDRHSYIQCDLSGHQFLKTCPSGNYYFDAITETCVDGPYIGIGLGK